MIELYTSNTANCQKLNIAMAELELEYSLHAVDLATKEQKAGWYLKLNPNGRIPALRDPGTGVTIAESGAILLYLAEKSRELMPVDPTRYWLAVQWIMWQMSSIGPLGGELGHFRRDPTRGQYALDRFGKELSRLLQVLETALDGQEYLAGEFSMADIAVWPWLTRYERLGLDLAARPAVRSWYDRIAARPKVQKGWAVLNGDAAIPSPSPSPSPSP